MMNLVYFLSNAQTTSDGGFCGDLGPILRIAGIVIFGIKVIVPIILIIMGMIDLAKAVTEKSEDKIKEAQNRLIKRAIAAVLVFLVATLVNIIFSVIISRDMDYKDCTTCLNKPFSSECKFTYGEI